MDVARGLIYIHNQGMSHGDLKGVRFLRFGSPSVLLSLPVKANILIDQTCHARIADFGLLTIVSDPANVLASSSYTQGGTARWMSPELIDPQQFGLKNSCPTKLSDCYALGMVIYETISGNLPFHEHTDLTVFVKVLQGVHPRRGAGFTDDLWRMLELCWVPQPSARPSIEDVLHCLERVSQSSESPYPGVNGDLDEGSDWDWSNNSSGMFSHFIPPRSFVVSLCSVLVCRFISPPHSINGPRGLGFRVFSTRWPVSSRMFSLQHERTVFEFPKRAPKHLYHLTAHTVAPSCLLALRTRQEYGDPDAPGRVK